MVSPSIALLLPGFKTLKAAQRKSFLGELSNADLPKTIILIDSDEKRVENHPENFEFVHFVHDNDIGNTLRVGMAAALSMGAEKVVTFEGYAPSNARWFLPFLEAGNVIESKRRGFIDMLVTETVNLLSFGNSYNVFSMNRVYTKEAALVVKDTHQQGKAFLVESAKALSAHKIKTVEVIREDVKKNNRSSVNLKEAASSIARSISGLFVSYGILSSLAYMVNLIAVYASLSLGLFYPVAVFLGGEFSAISNFLMNEKMNFKNRGFMSSVYRLGKFNFFALIPLVFDVLFIGYLARYTNALGKTLFTDLSVGVVLAASTVTFTLLTRTIWSKDNHSRVHV